MAKDDELQLHLLGRAGGMDAWAVYNAFGALLDLLKQAAARTDAPSRLSLSTVAEGSTTLGVRPPNAATDKDRAPINLVLDGAAELESSAGVPTGWDEEMVREIIRIGAAVEAEGIDGAALVWQQRAEGLRVDGQVLANARASLDELSRSIGSVRGVFDRYVHRAARREVGLVDEVSGKPLRISFPASAAAKVAGSIERRVLVWGEIRRNAKGEKVSMRLDDFEVLEEVGRPLAVEDLVGILGPEWTGGLGSVEWVRAQREK